MDITKDDIVFEIARRTIHNLEKVAEIAIGQDEANPRVFEVTHLLNSLLGLFVLPEEGWLPRQQRVRLVELYMDGWPKLAFDPRYTQPTWFRDFVEVFRDAIAHGNIEFIAVENEIGARISEVKFWNHEGGRKANPINFMVTISVSDIESMARKMADRILASRVRNLPVVLVETK